MNPSHTDHTNSTYPSSFSEDILPYRRTEESADFQRYAAILRRLRGPDGCPWDRAQTLDTLRRYIVEESFELVTAIQDGNHLHVAEELGDVLLVALLIGDALEQESGITLSEVLNTNADKLVRRHPHVFGTVDVAGSDEVVANWNDIKQETEKRPVSPGSVSSGLPPLERAQEIQKKAAKLGFDWDNLPPVLDKVREELSELETLITGKRITEDRDAAKNDPEIEKEIGDLLFSAVNVSRHLKADASVALARSNNAFLQRFQHIEQRLEELGKNMEDTPLEELDDLWNEAKNRE
jgi:tetrapyrrole methylase family protein / MazG family protein